MFEGWIIKFGSKIFPVEYMEPSGYSLEPQKQNLIEDWYDEAGYRHTDEYEHRPSQMTIEVKKDLHQKELEEIFGIIASGEKDGQNLYEIQYWDTREAVYKKGTFKMSDPKTKMKKVDTKNKDIIYDSFSIKFTEN